MNRFPSAKSLSFPFSLLVLAVMVNPLAVTSQTRQEETQEALFHRGEDPAVTRGRIAFFQRDLRNLDGNGRACADCHVPTHEFQLSPAVVKARFDFLQWIR
jgi:cytochrome c peroxidase